MSYFNLDKTLLQNLALAFAFTAGACGGGTGTGEERGEELTCDPAEDSDGDCLSNELEGCVTNINIDTDDDGAPDWADNDSDGDGVSDSKEALDCDAPVDSDQDGIPNHLDADSDNDGVKDGDEDRNKDGQLGNCTTSCSGPLDCDGAVGEACSLPSHGGPGICVSPACMDGETSPYHADTDLDGTKDDREGSFICHPQSSNNPFGLKRIRYVDSSETPYVDSDWRVALEVGALDSTPSITMPGPLDAAYTFDMTSPVVEVAGFLVSRKATDSLDALTEATAAISKIQNTGSIASVTVRISGIRTKSLDGFDTVLKTTLEVQASTETEVAEVRGTILSALLDRAPEDVDIPALPFVGEQSKRFIITFQTVHRPEENQTLFIGGVARAEMYDNRERSTGFHADDLSNGTALAQSGNGELIECQQFFAREQASADIILVIDESGSMSDDRERIAENAAALFNKALDTGLDFRMGVTDMNDTGPGDQPGIFATRQEGGTGDRWILPNEPNEFSAAVREPSGPDQSDGGSEHGLTQGRSALERHLPRDDADPQKVREKAKLVVIYITDERPDEVEDAGIINDFGAVEPTPEQMAQLQEFILPFANDFLEENAIAHLIAEPLPFSGSTCSGGEYAYGYYELINTLGGQMGSICQENLDPTLDAIIDSIVGDASPIQLEFVPISASIAVTRDDKLVRRSRFKGWDYRSGSNSVIFFNLPFDPARPSDTVVSYRRWADQVPLD